MSMLLSFFQGAPAQNVAAGGGAAGGDLNQYTWIIICALAGVIVAMGAFGGRFIMRLYGDLKRCQEERAQFVEDQLALLQTLHKEFEKPQE